MVELEDLMAFTPSAAVAGAALVLLLALLPIPSSVLRTPSASALAVTTAVFAGAAVAVNSLRAEEIASVSTTTLATVWFVSVAITLVASVVLGFRTKPKAGTPWPVSSWKDGIKEGKTRARALGKRIPSAGAEEIQRAWTEGLSQVAGNLSKEEASLAAALGPWRWLLETYLNSETSLPHPLGAAKNYFDLGVASAGLVV